MLVFSVSFTAESKRKEIFVVILVKVLGASAFGIVQKLSPRISIPVGIADAHCPCRWGN